MYHGAAGPNFLLFWAFITDAANFRTFFYRQLFCPNTERAGQISELFGLFPNGWQPYVHIINDVVRARRALRSPTARADMVARTYLNE